jgi:hypothetical protein
MIGDWRLLRNCRPTLRPPAWPEAEAGARIRTALQAWAQAAPRPLVIFIDEIDALQNATLISVLRQLRAGYNWRPTGFPAALALIGMRDVRDYKVASGGSERLNTASPFNVKTRLDDAGQLHARRCGGALPAAHRRHRAGLLARPPSTVPST